MYHIKFKYKDAYSHGKWNTQECTVSSVAECKKIYGLGIDCEYEILAVEPEGGNHEIEKPVVRYDPHGPSGNIYWILGEVSKAMRKQKRIEAFNALRDRVFSSGSYEEALQIIGEEVTLVKEQ